MLLSSNNPSNPKLSSLLVKERKKIQLREMIGRNNIPVKVNVTGNNNQKYIPLEIARAAEDIEKELEKLAVMTNEEYKARVQNEEVEQKIRGRLRNGVGMGFMDNGDLYSGNMKEGKRHDMGVCKLYKDGIYYRGEWVNDHIQGLGTMVKQDGLTIAGKFGENG